MSNTLKVGLDYAGWATDIFDCESSPIDDLLDAQGWVGFGIYFFLCQRAYGTDGYFYRWNYNNAASTARKMGGGVKSDTVKQVVSLCLQKGLFDDGLFVREGILTSRAIQKRYMLAIEKRSKNARTINKDYWLLKKDETKAYIIVPENTDSLPENTDSLPENTTKYSTVQYSTVQYSNVCAQEPKISEKNEKSFGKHGHTKLKQDEYISLCDKYGKAVIDKYIEQVDDYVENSGRKPYKNHVQTILKWLDDDGVKEQSKPSYDLDLLFEAALNSTPVPKKQQAEAKTEQREITDVYYACEPNSNDDIYRRMTGG